MQLRQQSMLPLPQGIRARRVLQAVPISRVLRSIDHTATKIQMIDKQEHVFHWHATLDANNPMMFKSTRAWEEDANGVTLDKFGGWK